MDEWERFSLTYVQKLQLTASWLFLLRWKKFLKLTVQIIHAPWEWLPGWIWLASMGHTNHLQLFSVYYCLMPASHIYNADKTFTTKGRTNLHFLELRYEFSDNAEDFQSSISMVWNYDEWFMWGLVGFPHCRMFWRVTRSINLALKIRVEQS